MRLGAVNYVLEEIEGQLTRLRNMEPSVEVTRLSEIYSNLPVIIASVRAEETSSVNIFILLTWGNSLRNDINNLPSTNQQIHNGTVGKVRHFYQNL